MPIRTFAPTCVVPVPGEGLLLSLGERLGSMMTASPKRQQYDNDNDIVPRIVPVGLRPRAEPGRKGRPARAETAPARGAGGGPGRGQACPRDRPPRDGGVP